MLCMLQVQDKGNVIFSKRQILLHVLVYVIQEGDNVFGLFLSQPNRL